MGILRLLGSLRLAVWLLAGTILFLFAGSVLMPLRPADYARMNDGLLFDWLASVAAKPVHFWFWAVLVLLSLLTANTLVCSVESLWRKRGAEGFWLRISPQLMHLGFLLILLAHLLSSGWGFRIAGALPEGGGGLLPDGSRLRVTGIEMTAYPSGMPRAWYADIEFQGAGGERVSGRLGPNRPVFSEGVGIYLKSVQFSRQGPVALLQVSRDPGALWALAGALVFTLGNFVLLGLKVRRGA